MLEVTNTEKFTEHSMGAILSSEITLFRNQGPGLFDKPICGAYCRPALV